MSVVTLDPKRFQSNYGQEIKDMFGNWEDALNRGMDSGREKIYQDTSSAVKGGMADITDQVLSEYKDHENLDPAFIKSEINKRMRKQFGDRAYYGEASDRYVTDDAIQEAISSEQGLRVENIDSMLAGYDVDWGGENIPITYQKYIDQIAAQVAEEQGISISDATKMVRQSPMFGMDQFEGRLQPWQQQQSLTFAKELQGLAKEHGPEYMKEFLSNQGGLLDKYQRLGGFGNIPFPSVEKEKTEPIDVTQAMGPKFDPNLTTNVPDNMNLTQQQILNQRLPIDMGVAGEAGWEFEGGISNQGGRVTDIPGNWDLSPSEIQWEEETGRPYVSYGFFGQKKYLPHGQR